MESVFKPLLPTTFEPFQPALLEPQPHCWPHGPPKATPRPQSSSLAIPPRPFRRPSPPLSPPNSADLLNSSPTSLCSMPRLVRPMFLPAALRPTEFPSREPTPPPDSDEEQEANGNRNTRSSFISLRSLGAFARLSRRSTCDGEDSVKALDFNLDLDAFPEPTGPPSRSHWKPDRDAAVCDDVGCQRRFILFTRRHHCRKCGDIFCDLHSARVIPLDEKANFNPRGSLSRSCEYCFSAFEGWRHKIMNPPPAPDKKDAEEAKPKTMVVALPPSDLSAPGLYESAMAALSAPSSYNWSTF